MKDNSYKKKFNPQRPSKELPQLPAEAEDCAVVLKTLADDTRLAVVRQLMSGPRHAGDLGAEVGVEQTLLSHHLRVLREGGIVLAERRRSVLYRLPKHAGNRDRLPRK